MPEPNSIGVGNQTAFSAQSPLQPFEYALTNGFEVFEWFPDKRPSGQGWEEDDLTMNERLEVRKLATAHRVRFSVHARWQANPLNVEDHYILRKDIRLAQDLGASLLCIHLYHEAGPEAYAQAILPLVDRLAEARIRLSIENTPLTTPEHFNELFAHLRELPAGLMDSIGMCFDMGHANLCQSALNDYLAYLDQLDPCVPIVHVHLHENWGDYDSHLPLFTGPAANNLAGVRGLIARLKQRGYSGAFILEQWPDPPSLLNEARQRFLRLWGESSDAAPPSERLSCVGEVPVRSLEVDG
jgi:sugar phosphate isomerase/epimerase